MEPEMTRFLSSQTPRRDFAAVRCAFRSLANCLLLASALAALLPSFADASGDSDRGKVLARVWCANCHIVDPEGTGQDIAPPFPVIAQRGTPDQREARAFLLAPHPPMPNFDLARQQIDDIVAYLNSLAKK
jgi:mono/diheme cytochrome c family protein